MSVAIAVIYQQWEMYPQGLILEETHRTDTLVKPLK